MLAKITKAFTFEAAHRLPHVPLEHKCSRLHGHNYRVEVSLVGEVQQSTGFVADFFDIDKHVGPLVESLDHRFLNDIEGLTNPTAEKIAEWFINQLNDLEHLHSIRIYENADCWAEVRR